MTEFGTFEYSSKALDLALYLGNYFHNERKDLSWLNEEDNKEDEDETIELMKMDVYLDEIRFFVMNFVLSL